MSRNPDHAMTLLEIILALTISAVVAVITLTALRQPTDSAMDKACIANRANLQISVDEFHTNRGRFPSLRNDELITEGFWNGPLPTCPTRQQDYSLRGGMITCPLHGE